MWKLKSFPAFGERLWNCLHPYWRKLTKAFKRKLHKLFQTVLGIEDYYVDAHSLILKFNANNYCTLLLCVSPRVSFKIACLSLSL